METINRLVASNKLAPELWLKFDSLQWMEVTVKLFLFTFLKIIENTFRFFNVFVDWDEFLIWIWILLLSQIIISRKTIQSVHV